MNASKPFVLFIIGIADSRQIEILGVRPDGKLRYLFNGMVDVMMHLKSEAFEGKRLILDTNPTSEVLMNRLPALLFNEIADADSHRITLNKLQNFIAAGQVRVPVINRPEHVLMTTRDSVSALLQNVPGLKAPLTRRIQPHSPAEIQAAVSEGLHYPVIIRPCGTHRGQDAYLLESPQAVADLHALALDGRDYYLIQYHDFREQGVFRKFRIAIIDGKPYIRHVRYSDHWMIHHQSSLSFMQANPAYIEAEIAIMQHFETELAPRIMPQIRAIHAAIGLDYFGIDCTIDAQDQMLLFEANACMHSLSSSETTTNRYDEPMAKIHAALHALIQSRLPLRSA